MVDKEGYRANIGIVLINDNNQVLLAKRKGENSWQLPQGGIDKGESDTEALYRELEEEVGLTQNQVQLLAKTPKWLRYNLPKNKQNKYFIGQKQVWFLLKITCSDDNVCLDKHTEIEFDDWLWVDYWHPISAVVDFKKHIYEDMLKILATVVFDNNYVIPVNLQRPLKKSAVLLDKILK